MSSGSFDCVVACAPTALKMTVGGRNVVCKRNEPPSAVVRIVLAAPQQALASKAESYSNLCGKGNSHRGSRAEEITQCSAGRAQLFNVGDGACDAAIGIGEMAERGSALASAN